MASTLLSSLQEILFYDPGSGVFTWLVSRDAIPAGTVAGNIDSSNGYLRIRAFGKLYYAHRLAWLYETGEWPTSKVDHRNNQRTDNHFDNLRLASDLDNARNCLIGKNNTSGLKGAHFFKRDSVWVAEITVKRRNIYLGRFGSKEEAHAAYVRAAEKHFGKFARAA